jgi:hypothetical protein
MLESENNKFPLSPIEQAKLNIQKEKDKSVVEEMRKNVETIRHSISYLLENGKNNMMRRDFIERAGTFIDEFIKFTEVSLEEAIYSTNTDDRKLLENAIAALLKFNDDLKFVLGIWEKYQNTKDDPENEIEFKKTIRELENSTRELIILLHARLEPDLWENTQE